MNINNYKNKLNNYKLSPSSSVKSKIHINSDFNQKNKFIKNVIKKNNDNIIKLTNKQSNIKSIIKPLNLQSNKYEDKAKHILFKFNKNNNLKKLKKNKKLLNNSKLIRLLRYQHSKLRILSKLKLKRTRLNNTSKIFNKLKIIYIKTILNQLNENNPNLLKLFNYDVTKTIISDSLLKKSFKSKLLKFNSNLKLKLLRSKFKSNRFKTFKSNILKFKLLKLNIFKFRILKHLNLERYNFNKKLFQSLINLNNLSYNIKLFKKYKLLKKNILRLNKTSNLFKIYFKSFQSLQNKNIKYKLLKSPFNSQYFKYNKNNFLYSNINPKLLKSKRFKYAILNSQSPKYKLLRSKLLKMKNISSFKFKSNRLKFKLKKIKLDYLKIKQYKLLYKNNKSKLYKNNLIKKITNNITKNIKYKNLELLKNLKFKNNINKKLFEHFIFNKLKLKLKNKILNYKKIKINRRRFKFIPGRKRRVFNKLKKYIIKLKKYYFINYKKRFTEHALRHYMAVAYVLSTNNNTLITIKNFKKKVFSWITAGSYGYKNTQKSTPFAAESMALDFGKYLKWTHKINNIIIKIKGFGKGRRTIVKGFKYARLAIYKIQDRTPIAHNGCRKKKKRRI